MPVESPRLLVVSATRAEAAHVPPDLPVLITGIGTLVVAYSATYLDGHPLVGRFLLTLFAFMGAMLGTVLSENLIALFVFWEVTGIASFLLIGFKGRGQAAPWCPA